MSDERASSTTKESRAKTALAFSWASGSTWGIWVAVVLLLAWIPIAMSGRSAVLLLGLVRGVTAVLVAVGRCLVLVVATLGWWITALCGWRRGLISGVRGRSVLALLRRIRATARILIMSTVLLRRRRSAVAAVLVILIRRRITAIALLRRRLIISTTVIFLSRHIS
jgi:hypothetical protein